MSPSNKVVVAFHLFRRGGRPPLVYHRGVKAISTLVAHSPEEYAKVRLGSGERILISTSQQGVRISKLWYKRARWRWARLGKYLSGTISQAVGDLPAEYALVT